MIRVKKKHGATFVALICVLSQPERALSALDFSPQLEAFNMEGIKMSQLVFSNGTKEKAMYQPPVGWKYAGDQNSLDLTPEDVTQARATITKWPATTPVSFGPEGRKQLVQQFISMLPEGNQEVKVESEELNPLKINGKQTYLVELTYTNYGARFSSYSLLLDRRPEAICFRLTCRAGDYEKLREAFRRSLYSWQNL
jgi:hypothetical protein